MEMYNQIEQILVRTLSPFEYERLEQLKDLKGRTISYRIYDAYSEEQVVAAYKQYGDKPIKYIEKVLKTIKKTPDWLNREIVNEPIDNETKKDFEDFNNFLEDFRNETNNKKNKNEI